MEFNIIERCRCCYNTDLVPYFDMGEQPPANALLSNTDTERRRFPLKVMLCSKCYHSQLSVAINPKALFFNYPYQSGISQTFVSHCQELVTDAISRVSVSTPKVLDIASNDGTLLKQFKDRNCEVLGVDPSVNLKPLADAKGVPTIWECWNTVVAQGIKNQFEIITAQNVLAHVHDLDDFLSGCDIALKDGGVVIIEFAYGKPMLERYEFDTIYHEHLSYFLVNSFKSVVKHSNFYIDDLKQLSIHGGSLRCYLRKKPGANKTIVTEFVEAERAAGLLDRAVYQGFQQKIDDIKNELVSVLNNQKEKAVGFAASAKGITMLNYFDIDLAYIVDDTPSKQGKFIPGKKIPVLPASQLTDDPDDLCVLILAWNFYNEIKNRVVTLRQHKHTKVIDYNKMEVVTL